MIDSRLYEFIRAIAAFDMDMDIRDAAAQWLMLKDEAVAIILAVEDEADKARLAAVEPPAEIISAPPITPPKVEPQKQWEMTVRLTKEPGAWKEFLK